MNCQKKPPKEVIDFLNKNNIEYVDVAHYAWPIIFGSTSGPREGIGGCAITSFTVEAWVCDDIGPTVYTCAGMYSFENSSFEPFTKKFEWKNFEE